MKIKKIILNVGKGILFGGQKEVVFENLSEKKINIFFMPNTSGKSLIFNALEHLFSFNKDVYIKDTNADLEIKIEFILNSEEYTYRSNCGTPYKILKDGEEIKGFDKILEEYIGIKGEKLEYYGNNRNSLSSLNRFNFLDFSNLGDKEESNEISFINSKYDGTSRKFILAYILGAPIDGTFFKLITEYEYKKEFIKKHKGKFKKYSKELNQISLIDNNLKDLFIRLEDFRIMYGDISIAIKELGLLKKEYILEFGNNKNDDNLIFLTNEIKKIEKERENIKNDINKVRDDIKGRGLLEGEELLRSKILKPKDLEDFKKYNSYKKDLKKIDEIKIQNYLSTKIEPFIKDFKDFLVDLYDIFVKKVIESNLLNKEEIIKNNNIVFKEESLTIEAFFKTSEGMRKTLRILTFVGLHIFSNKNKTKCLDYSFYDSFIENLDHEYREILFDTLFKFIENNNLEVPQMICFITKVEKDGNENSINKLGNKYPEYINLIDSNGIK